MLEEILAVSDGGLHPAIKLLHFSLKSRTTLLLFLKKHKSELAPANSSFSSPEFLPSGGSGSNETYDYDGSSATCTSRCTYTCMLGPLPCVHQVSAPFPSTGSPRASSPAATRCHRLFASRSMKCTSLSSKPEKCPC